MTAHAPVVLDIAGTRLTAADRRRLKHPLTGGLILFARNWADRRQLTELTAAVKDVRPDLLICVDNEGGRVQRFRTGGFTALPAMRVLGEMWMHDPLGATDAATALGHVLASELRACGVDLSFTPVLDLDHGGSSVIGDRAFHRDARVVTLLAKSVMHGLLRRHALVRELAHEVHQVVERVVLDVVFGLRPVLQQRGDIVHVVGTDVALVGSRVHGDAVGAGLQAQRGRARHARNAEMACIAQQRHLVDIDRQPGAAVPGVRADEGIHRGAFSARRCTPCQT